MNDEALYIAEIPFDNGTVRFRYSRIMSEDGKKWIRHGLYKEYHPNGVLASEGEYDLGLETGLWKDYHDNGHLAAQGEYKEGKEIGIWQYWDAAGNHEESEDFGV